MRKKATQTVKIDDVAFHAKVSPSTVSLFIRKPEKVSKKTGDKIQKSIDELGYVYNKIASQFTGSKSKTISIIVPSISNEVFSDILQRLEEIVSTKGFQLKIASHDHNLIKEEEQIRSMLEWSPSTLIITGQEHTESSKKMLNNTSSTVIQMMDLDGTFSRQVGFDQEKSGFDATQYLRDSGCRKIAFFATRFEDDIRAQKRYNGYCKAISNFEGGCTPILIDIPYSRNSYEDARRHLSQALAKHRGIDGIVATNDAIGIGSMIEAHERGIKIPEQMSVIGFGDFSISACLAPITLSSVNLHSEQMAQKLAELTFASFDSTTPLEKNIDTGYSIIPRGSTKLIY
ncbi:LacI family DNA-binding transcriptional regulator [Vibrio campbellii]|uniref:LacI family DNA-binding transcriptional regulator n=1 Tax=Vibrio campbellii TaxID=680 RepID=UPI0005EF8BAC|nr:LacI family DNA-binding transcriptional regulator [Vibrio campbellii]